MTRQQAKSYALRRCKPFQEQRVSNMLDGWAAALQEQYARSAEQVILATLNDILRRTPGATLSLVQDTFIIETESPRQAEQVSIDLRVTHAGVVIDQPRLLARIVGA